MCAGLQRDMLRWVRQNPALVPNTVVLWRETWLWIAGTYGRSSVEDMLDYLI